MSSDYIALRRVERVLVRAIELVDNERTKQQLQTQLNVLRIELTRAKLILPVNKRKDRAS